MYATVVPPIWWNLAKTSRFVALGAGSARRRLRAVATRGLSHAVPARLTNERLSLLSSFAGSENVLLCVPVYSFGFDPSSPPAAADGSGGNAASETVASGGGGGGGGGSGGGWVTSEAGASGEAAAAAEAPADRGSR